MAIDQKISTTDILEWAQRRINLSSDDAAKYREQGDHMKDRLEKYIDAHPDFDLVKMLNSGSVAKGLALRSISDMDVAVYVKRASAPDNHTNLVGWLRDRLRDAYDNIIPPERITSDDACVRISYSGTGVDVECVPILYDGDADDYGDLILRNGMRVRTNIRKHIEFVRKRKKQHPVHYAQVLRLLKHWRRMRAQEGYFPLPGFALDLIATRVIDASTDASNYPQILQSVFSYIVKTGLNDPVVFEDYYARKDVKNSGGAVRVYDPVCADNNVTSQLTDSDRAAIVDAAADALDDIAIARTATTKEASIAAWQALFGPEFTI